MEVFWGRSTTRAREIGRGTFHCAACAQPREYRRLEIRRWDTFCGVPVRAREVIDTQIGCAQCGRRFAMEVLEAPARPEAAAKLDAFRRAAAALMVNECGNTLHAREAAIAWHRAAGAAAYDDAQLDADRATAALDVVADAALRLSVVLPPAGGALLLRKAATVAAADGQLSEKARVALGTLGGRLGLDAAAIRGVVDADRSGGHREERNHG